MSDIKLAINILKNCGYSNEEIISIMQDMVRDMVTEIMLETSMEGEEHHDQRKR